MPKGGAPRPQPLGLLFRTEDIEKGGLVVWHAKLGRAAPFVELRNNTETAKHCCMHSRDR